jgi:hypothetical protein
LAQVILGRPMLYGLVSSIPGTGLGETHLKEPTEPRGIPAFSAAAALEHAEVAEGVMRMRRAWAEAWRSATETLPVLAATPLEKGGSGFLRFAATCPAGADVDGLAAALKVFGVMRSYPQALPALEVAGRLAGGVVGVPPGAAHLASSLLTFPTHPLVSRRDVDQAIRRTKSFRGVGATG